LKIVTVNWGGASATIPVQLDDNCVLHHIVPMNDVVVVGTDPNQNYTQLVDGSLPTGIVEPPVLMGTFNGTAVDYAWEFPPHTTIYVTINPNNPVGVCQLIFDTPSAGLSLT